MKLKKLKFKDVLSHTDTQVDIADFLTVFTGVSESGKSAVIRGLDQVLRNHPAGIDLLRHGAKRGACSEETVVFETDDGKTHDLVRRRGKSKNEYVLDGQPLLAIGREVPEEISSLLRLSPHAFQLQSDGNFLLRDTDGEVAKALSSTVGLTQIDAAFAQIRSRKNENDTALRVSQADSDREQAACDKFAALTDADAAVADAEAVERLRSDANSAMEGTARLFYGLSALPADRADKLVLASKQIHDAEAPERAAVAVGVVAGDMRRTADALARIPPDTDTGSAKCDVIAASAKQSILSALNLVLEAMTALGRRFESLRPDIGMMPRRATLLITRASAAGDKVIEAEAEVAGMVGLLGRLDGCPSVCQTISAGGFLKRANETCEAAEIARADVAAANSLLAKILAAKYASDTSAGNVRFAEEEIERYKREHPVCPECGAEQKHWHVA